MEENRGYLAAIEALGDKIVALRESLMYSGYRVDNLESDLKRKTDECEVLRAENAKLTKMLDAVHQYIEKMEE